MAAGMMMSGCVAVVVFLAIASLNGVASAPDRSRCLVSGKCYLKLLSCPTSCPSRSTTGAGKSACFMDCTACTATCRHRKTSCIGFGAVCYDPRFIGGDGVMFYFHGKKNQDFCLVSDQNIHINAHFIGKRPEGRTRDYTWVQSLGIMFGTHQLSVGAKKVAKWEDNVDQLQFSLDGESFDVPQFEGALWTSPARDVVVERTDAANTVHIIINQLMEVSISAVPITHEESRVHNYQITEDDCFAHLNMQFNFFNLSPNVDGVLGQTYQPKFQTPVKVGIPMPLMGGDEKYLSSSIVSTDCKVSKFSATAKKSAPKVQAIENLLVAAEEVTLGNALPMASWLHCKGSGRNGISCRR